jgi:hypothetical protein
MTEQQQDKKLSKAAEVLITADSLKQAVHKIINSETKNSREQFHDSYKESFGLDD